MAAAVDPVALGQAVVEARDLDIRLDDLLYSLPKRGGTDLQKGIRARLRAEVSRLRELRQYLDYVREENDRS